MLVYKAVNMVNGKVYVGQTRGSLEHRMQRHLRNANAASHIKFYNAIRKYGKENFVWSVVAYANSKEELNRLETYYIQLWDTIKSGYNMIDGGDNNIMDVESVREKHRRRMQSSDVREKISATMRKKISAGELFTAEHRARLSKAAMGNHNFGDSDTRSIGCFCVLDDGQEVHFHSYLDGGKWWYEHFAPFPYSACTYQRKIKQSIQSGVITFRGKPITGIHWYKEVE